MTPTTTVDNALRLRFGLSTSTANQFVALSIAYWVILNVLCAVGEGGVLTPVLAAWSANLLFGAAALYMILTVRT